MLYAGAKELMRNTSEVGKVIDIESVDDLEEIPQKLQELREELGRPRERDMRVARQRGEVRRNRKWQGRYGLVGTVG